MKDPNAEIEYQCATLIDYLSAVKDVKNDDDLIELYSTIVLNLASKVNLLLKKTQREDFLSANTAVIEICDEHSKHILRRNVPLYFTENNNGIILKGEDADGKDSTIAFLSEGATEKIMELLGRGSDKRHPHHHNECE